MKKKDKDEILDAILEDAEQDATIEDLIDSPSEDFIELRPKVSADVPVTTNQSKEIIHHEEDSKNLEEDAQKIRENLYELIDVNQVALKDLLNFASQTQSPRAYEVLAQLIRTMKENNEALLDIHKQKSKIENGSGGGGGPKTLNQTAIFLGSTAELDEMVSEHLDKLKKAIPIDQTERDKK